MSTFGRKRRFCTECNEEFSERYFRRHKCDVKENASNSLETPKSVENEKDKELLNQESILVTEPAPMKLSDEEPEKEPEEGFNASSDSEEELLEPDVFDEYFSEDREHTELEEGEHLDLCESYVTIILKALLVWQAFHFISDAAFTVILYLLRSIFYLFSFSSKLAKSVLNIFPKSLYQVHKFISLKKDDFKKYVVCVKCHCLYDFRDCIQVVEGIKISKSCSNVVMPNHRMSHYRQPCGELLLKSIDVGGKKKLIARKTFCYKSIKSSLQRLVNRRNFEDKCEQWRVRNSPNNVLSDVYDGEIWQKFNGGAYDFFTSERNYGIMLNVDWFQPFKYSSYSVGAIYLSILNLPREERFKKKNIILVGLIPDMKSEPPTNSFIEPLVEELQEAWNGFYFKSFKSTDPVKFRLALICVGCDIPASRKLCGFLGHGATRGCNKCMKQFEGGIGEKNYGGFVVSEWQLRDSHSHREIVRKIVKAKTKSRREELEKHYGIRYSVLLELDYFDPIRMTVIDPMHNLFLGTAKRVFNLWIDYKVLNQDDLIKIQANVEKIFCPSEIGKLPQKLASSFGSFNADQWKNWTILFSIYALKGVVPPAHLEYWRKFVLACKILCSRSLTKSNVKVAHLLLITFCEKIERAFSGKGLTMNMHLHAHLERCVFDFGPVYSFWLFSFERENGVLGSVPTNKRCIEMQLMRKFEKSMHVIDISCSETVMNEFGPDFSKMLSLYEDKDRGTLGQMKMNTMMFDYLNMSSKHCSYDAWNWEINIDECLTFSASKICTLDEQDVFNIQQMYCKLYSDVSGNSMSVCMSCRSVTDVTIFGSLLGIKSGRSSRSSIILAYWCADNGNISSFDNMDLEPRPGQISKIYLHNVIIDGRSCVHVLAKVQWYAKLEDSVKNYYGKPVSVWKQNVFEQEGPASFIPIQRIRCKVVYAYDIIGQRNVIVVVPREQFLS